MSTIIKCISELPWLSQLVTMMLVVFVMSDLVMVKFVFRWWEGVRVGINGGVRSGGIRREGNGDVSRMNVQRNQGQIVTNTGIETTKRQFKDIILQLIKSYTIIEPCTRNLSSNKVVCLFIAQIQVYLVLCTQIFIKPGPVVWIDLLVRLCMFLAWIGLVLGMGDIFVRYRWVSGLMQSDKVQTKLDLSLKQQIAHPKKTNTKQPKNTKLPISLYLYYTTIAATSITLSILTITTILTSNSPQAPINYYYRQSQSSLITLFIIIGILTVMHHIVWAVVGGLLWVCASMLGFCVGRVQVWEVMLGYPADLRTNVEVMGVVEQSKQNIANQTYRNHIQNLIFTEPAEVLKTQNSSSSKIKRSSNKVQNEDSAIKEEDEKKYNQKIKAKSNVELSETKGKKKKEIFAMPTEFSVNEGSQEPVNGLNTSVSESKSLVKRKKCFSREISSKESIDFSFSPTDAQSSEVSKENNTKKAKKFFMKQPTPIQITSLKIKPKESQQSLQIFTGKQDQICQKEAPEESEDVLCNIQNKIQVDNPIKNRKKINKQLKVLNYGENEHEIDVIDLSEYAVKDLGHANTTEFHTPTFNFRKKSHLPSLHYATPQNALKPIKQKGDYYVRKKNSLRTPNVSDPKAEGVTFCLQDLSKK